MMDIQSFYLKISSALRLNFERIDQWTDNAETKKMLERIKQRHDVLGIPPSSQSIIDEINKFKKTTMIYGWKALRHLCFGVGVRDYANWCILSDEVLLGKLISIIEGQEPANKRIKCFRALLSSYFSFKKIHYDKKSIDGWLTLRSWLLKTLPNIVKISRMKYKWLSILHENQNLLKDDPCLPYGEKLLIGESAEFQKILEGLNISSDSWLREEAIIAQIKIASHKTHHDFLNILKKLITISSVNQEEVGKSGIIKSEYVESKCIGLLVSRYAKLPEKKEHIQLRDAAIRSIGNPWLKRTAWDSYVVNSDGQPDNEAREMVNGWIKRRLICDFFELLSEYGASDERRLQYWLELEPNMDDMWFALGSSARLNRSEGFMDFNARAKGRLLNLESGTSKNNAFIMKIEKYVAVEFGEPGNACYLFEWRSLPEPVLEKLLSGKDSIDISIYQLKDQKMAKDRLVHIDRNEEPWEKSFDRVIHPLLKEPPSRSHNFSTILRDLARKNNIEIRDNRPKNGALWVYTDNSDPAIVKKLISLGFKYKANKGWWKE